MFTMMLGVSNYHPFNIFVPNKIRLAIFGHLISIYRKYHFNLSKISSKKKKNTPFTSKFQTLALAETSISLSLFLSRRWGTISSTSIFNRCCDQPHHLRSPPSFSSSLLSSLSLSLAWLLFFNGVVA